MRSPRPAFRICAGALELTPNDLFGVSAKMDGEVSQLNSWAMKTALRLQELSPAVRHAVDGLLAAVPKR